MTPLAKALALAELNMYVMPAREKDEVVTGRDGKSVLKLAKTPYTWNGLKDASSDPTVIAKWWGQWPDALVAVNAGMSGLVALDVDMGHDDKTGEVHDGWGSLDEAGLLDELPDTFTYQTKRGGDHLIYTDPQTVPLGPTQAHETPDGVKIADADRRGGASYFIWWGDEVPASRDVFKAPPAWLLTPAKESRVDPEAMFDGSIEEWFGKCAEGEPSEELVSCLEEMADKQGHINHQEMIDFQRYLVGLAADRLEPGVPQILRSFRELYIDYPTDSGKDWAREFDLGLSGAIKKHGAFAESPRDILEREKGSEWLNGVGGSLMELLTGLPEVRTPEALRARVAYLMSQAISAGRTVLDAATLGWASAAAKAPGGIRESLPEKQALTEIWNIAWQVAAQPVTEEPLSMDLEPIEPQTDTPATPAPERRVALLHGPEIAHLPQVEWWGTGFMARMRELNNPINEQYFHLSMWITLSLAFAQYAHLLTRNGTKIPLNFYGIVVGPSDSGKSESLGIIRQIIDTLEMGNEWDLGGDATPAGLTQALTRRHMNGGGASLLHPDEADATLREWSDERGPFAGMKQRITDIYMGRVPKMQRSMAKDVSDVNAEAQLNVHLTGVKERIADAILPDDWTTGFINRFVWAMGTKSRLSDDQLRFELLGEQEIANDRSGAFAWVNTWAAQFRGLLSWLPVDGKPAVIGASDAVIARHVETRREFERIAARRPGYEERLMATFGRLHVTILKCSALVAITHKRRRIEVDDYLIALAQAEEWGENILTMIEATDETPRSREVQRLAGLIESHGGRMPLPAIHRSPAYRGDQRHVNSLVEELLAQGRAERLEERGKPAVIRLVKEVS